MVIDAQYKIMIVTKGILMVAMQTITNDAIVLTNRVMHRRVITQALTRRPETATAAAMPRSVLGKYALRRLPRL